ncbi:MAG: dihydroneopterin aldolase [Marinilabiliales bacterium]|nr:MAG: dihydroneopterin aldolase [Marinilabiliales bacterium]
MATLQIEEMEFHAFHGIYEEEQLSGNKFLVDLTIELDIEKAAKSDQLEDALDYSKAYEIIKREMQIRAQLLEHLARRIINRLSVEFENMQMIEIKISKCAPPIGGKAKAFSITDSRTFR